MKSRFVQFLKGVFGWPGTNGNGAHVAVEAGPPPVATAEPASAAPASPINRPSAPTPTHGGLVRVPLQPILNSLPLELRAKVTQAEVGNLTVPVVLSKILSQLGSGAVKIPFGVIRQAAPHVFAGGTDCDLVSVALPLGEVLARVNPALLVRRPTQKQVEVPADIASPFGDHGKGLALSQGGARPEPPAPPRNVTPGPLATPKPAMATAPTRNFIAPSIAPPIPPTATPPKGSASLTPTAFKPTLPSLRPISHPPGPPGTRPASPPSTAPEPTTLGIALTALAENWPDAIRQEIVQLNLVETRFAMPVDLVEAALKRGRVAFPWKVLRSWIRPAPLPTVSAHDAAELELPLKVIAPIFLARQSAAAKNQPRLDIDEQIPNLFFGFPKPDSPGTAPGATAAACPPDTNYYVWDDNSDTAHVDQAEVKRKGPGGTDFVSRCATPNEIVSRAAALDGVAGALVALPDGLMVASRIPPDLNGDTLAAFLPQIFAKVSMTTKELRMGELNNLNFTVGNVPWKIFRVHAIFFAAFGRAGEALPTAQLAALAAEMDRKKN